MVGSPNDEGRWKMSPLLEFRRPTPKVFTSLESILAKQPTGGSNSLKKLTSLAGKPTSKGSLDKIVERLRKSLLTDYKCNLKECGDWQGSFDYRVLHSETVPDDIEVVTRLFNPKEGGNIFYARCVLRSSAKEYLFWDAE